MKLIVSTFLVYKVKKCLLKSGKVILFLYFSKETLYQDMPKRWAHDAQGLGSSYKCSFLYLVDYIVPYSYCKLTIIFSIPNPTCQSSILFLVSIYILHYSS